MDIANVSKLGFGTSQIGGPSLMQGERIGAKAIPKKDAIAILRYAYDSGINFFDTSDKYGNAEELLGEAFAKRRGSIVIATKCGLADTVGRDFSISHINACIENSLKRLKTDYIDIFQLTKPDVSQVTDELLSFFEGKIKEGCIRYFGVSVIGNDDGQVYLSKSAVKSFQIFYNLLFVGNHELIHRCAQNDRFVIVRSPLNSGMLSGRYTSATKFENVDIRSRIFHGTLLVDRLESVRKIKSYFNLSSDELLTFSLNFLFSNDDINAVIPAASRIEQLERYVQIFSENKRFTKAKIKEILRFAQKEISHNNRGQLA